MPRTSLGWKTERNMEEKEQQAGETTPPNLDIPWFKRWEDKDKTPPDFIARLEELEYK